MWRELLRFFAFLGRVGAFVFSVITLALIALTLVQRDWMDGISIYIVVMSVVSMLAAFVPPYPNFIFDSFFAVAWIICATFSFLIMFLKSTCYGVADVLPGEEVAVSCPKYQALVAFSFLTFGAWGGSAGIGGLLLLIGIFKNARARSHNFMVAPTIRKERQTTKTEPATDAADSAPIPPPPAPVHFAETRTPADEEKGPFADPDEVRPYYDSHYDDKRPLSMSDEKRPVSDDKRPLSEEKRPYPAAYGSATYHVEDVGENHKAYAAPAPVAAAPIVEETRSIEEEWEPAEPEYYTAPGWGAGFMQRHWVLLGFLALIGAAILLPIVILYAIPAFAVYVTDNIQLPRNFYGAITGFYEDHATFDIFTSFRAPGGISATIQPTTLMMFLGDTIDDPIPVAYVEVSKLKIGGGPVEAYNQSLRIGNITEWSRLWRRFAFEDELELGVGGEIKVKVGPITVGVDTKKTQKFQGLLNATKLELEYLRITPPDADGANIVAAVPVTNPSPLTVDSGAGATADFVFADVPVANAFIDEFKLVKGNGTLVAKARVDPDVLNGVVSNFGTIIGEQLPFLGRGFAVATIQATSILQDGVAWPYWVAGARAIKLDAAVEVLPLIGNAAGDILGDLLTGQFGNFLGLEPATQTIDVNVTAINNVLRQLKFYDAVEIGATQQTSLSGLLGSGS